MTSPSLDFLIRLKNAYIAGKKSVIAPSSKHIVDLASIIKKHDFIKDYLVTDLPNNSKQIKVSLNYINKKPSLSGVKLYSKPGRRIYCDSVNIPWGITPKSLIIISTSKGLLNQKQAQKSKIGGELIAQIW